MCRISWIFSSSGFVCGCLVLSSLSGHCFVYHWCIFFQDQQKPFNSPWWSLQQISGVYSEGFLTRFIIFSIPHIRHGLIDNTQNQGFCFRPWRWVIVQLLAGSEGLENVHSFLVTQFERLPTSWALIFWWSLRTQSTHQAESYTPAANPVQSGCLGMEEPIIREHFEECYWLSV